MRLSSTFGLLASISITLLACGDDSNPTGGGGSGGSASGGGPEGGGEVGGQPEGGSGGAGGAEGGGGEGGAGGAMCGIDPEPSGSALDDPDNACATLLAAGEPLSRIVFVDRGEDSTFTQAIELNYAFRYAYRVPQGEKSEYTVEQYRCEQPAGEDEQCFTIDDDPPTMECATVFGPRFAVDDTQYNEGDNHYRFTMRLLRDHCVVESSDTFEMTLTYAPQ